MLPQNLRIRIKEKLPITTFGFNARKQKIVMEMACLPVYMPEACRQAKAGKRVGK